MYHIASAIVGAGKKLQNIQWDTMRGIRMVYSNYIHTTPSGITGSVLTDGRKTTFITNSPSNAVWFRRFMEGSHDRMGDIRMQDLALTIDVLIELQELLEHLWIEAENDQNSELQFDLASIDCAVCLGFSSGLRGEELGHIRLKDSMMLSIRGLRHPGKPHIVLALEGRFKGHLGRKKHKIPLSLTTASGIQNKVWFLRLCKMYDAANIHFGPFFRSNPSNQSPARVRNLDTLFHRYLLDLQALHPSLLPESVDVINLYSVRRSLRRGSTTQARNKRVPRNIINLSNRWRSEKSQNFRAGAGGETMEVYTDLLAAIETILQYSEPL